MEALRFWKAVSTDLACSSHAVPTNFMHILVAVIFGIVVSIEAASDQSWQSKVAKTILFGMVASILMMLLD